MSEEIRRRAACDRCHSQKIRCPRHPGRDVCDRCIKARTPCVFSPFRQKKTTEGEPEPEAAAISQQDSTQTEPTDKDGLTRQKRKRLARDTDSNTIAIAPGVISIDAHAQNSAFDIDPDPLGLGWMSNSFSISQAFVPDDIFNDVNFESHSMYPPLNFGNTMLNDLDTSTPSNPVRFRRDVNLGQSLKVSSNLLPNPNEVRPLASVRGSRSNLNRSWYSGVESWEDESTTSLVRKLSQLNIDLFEHKATVPPMSIHDDDPCPPVDDADKPGGQYILEETFRLTQTLVEIYPSFLNSLIASSETSSPNEDLPSFSMTEDTRNSLLGIRDEGLSSTPKSTKPPLDHASILLLISCHLRLISIYEMLFQHMEVCINQRGMTKNFKQAALTVPSLSIGTFVPPPSSAVPMQILLLVQFASQLNNYAADLASEIQGPEDSSSSEATTDPTLRLAKAAAENVKDRAGNMSHELSDLRGRMLSSGLLA